MIGVDISCASWFLGKGAFISQTKIPVSLSIAAMCPFDAGTMINGLPCDKSMRGEAIMLESNVIEGFISLGNNLFSV